AVVAAVARADAAVVHLRVEAFLGVVCSVHGTDRFAGSDLAMLAEHGLEDVDGLVLGSALPALEPHPLLSAAVRDLGLAHHRHVVLCRAGDHAGLAARAGISVHRHAPAVLGILDGRIHAGMARVLRWPAP